MLDTMRRNARRLYPVLWLVIIAFIAFIPGMAPGPDNVVVRVGGDPIYLDEYRVALQQQTAYYREMSGGSLPDDFLQQIQIEQIVLESLIRERLILVAARDQGFSVSDREISERIQRYPTFVEDGVFIGRDRYVQLLRNNGIETEDFEQDVADEILYQKFTELLSNGVTVIDREVEDEYQRRNEQVQFNFFVVQATGLEQEVASLVADGVARTLFEANVSDYRLPERRAVSYVVIATEDIRNTVELPEDVLRAAFDESVDEFTVPEQVRARHVLFRLPPDPDDERVAETRAAAQAVLDEILAGADFAELATTNSDDAVSASAGGDLGWFGRGRMAPEFEAAAFGLEVGGTSDLVETSFGIHIIRLEGQRPEQVRPFDEVRAQLEQTIAWERAEELADQRAEEMRMAVLRRIPLQDLAEQFGLEIREGGLFDQALGLSDVSSPEFTRQVFATGRGRVSEPIRFAEGYVVFQVDEIVEAHDPVFDEVQDAVRADLVRQLSEERAAEIAADLGERLEQGEAFETVARERGLRIQSTELIPRSGVVPELGRQSGLVLAAFELSDGQTGGPVRVDQGHALISVTAHVQPDWGQFNTEREALYNDLLNQRRSSLFESLVSLLRDKYRVVTYEEVRSLIST